MNITELWEKALRRTTIVRPRVQGLETFHATVLPYIFLSESVVNSGDTVVRTGEVRLEKPSLVLPSHSPFFEGFEFDEAADAGLVTNFLLVRGVSFPSLKYENKTGKLEVKDGPLSKQLRLHGDELGRKED